MSSRFRAVIRLPCPPRAEVRAADETYGHPDPFEKHDGGRTGSRMYAAFHIYDRIAEDIDGIPAAEGMERLGYGTLRDDGADGAIDLGNMTGLNDGDFISALTPSGALGQC